MLCDSVTTIDELDTMSKLPDFENNELKLINDTLNERYGAPVETQRADIELRIHPDDRELTECPAVYWECNGCHFILAKTGDSQFFSQFFYSNNEQFGTGKQIYHDLLDCLVTTLRIQADHELERNKVKELSI